jgi:hypothetical protein
MVGLTLTKGPLAGIRVRGSVGALVEALRSLGHRVTQLPIEDGPPASACVGGLRTWGSPWLDVFERGGVPPVLDDAFAARLSGAARSLVLRYDYEFPDGAISHSLYDGGQRIERFHEASPPSASALAGLNERYAAWRMRDWGISFEDLAARRLPFPPQIIVEACFLEFDSRPERGSFSP